MRRQPPAVSGRAKPERTLRVLARRPRMRSAAAAGAAPRGGGRSGGLAHARWRRQRAGGELPSPAAGGTRTRFPPSSRSHGCSPCDREGRRRKKTLLPSLLAVRPSLRRHPLLRGPGRPEAAPGAPLPSGAPACYPHRLKFATSGLELLETAAKKIH